MFSKLYLITSFLLLFNFVELNDDKDSKVPESDLNKAVSCLHVLSKKFDYEIEPNVYSSTMLACFTQITELDAKEILVAVQQEMKILSPEEIDNLCDVNKLKNMDQNLLKIESNKLKKALTEFDKMREHHSKKDNKAPKDEIDNENDEYKKAHPSRGNTLGKFMKKMTNTLDLFNNFGKIIIGIRILYFLFFLWNNCKEQNRYEHKYEDYSKIAKNVKKNKKKKN